jgi:aspartate carbamoyltransferase catalytic subunit
MVGDLKNGRTVHSLSKALAHWNTKLILCAPNALKMPAELVAQLREQGLAVIETENMDAALGQADVAYVTRIQQERFAQIEEYLQYKGVYVITAEAIAKAKAGITIMHPLPRVDEITTDVDPLPNAAYFRQARYGVFTRMALLAMVLGAV